MAAPPVHGAAIYGIIISKPPLARLRVCKAPVSYTHLDVYKRQELCVLAGIVPGALGMQLCTQVSEALCAALPESTPVRVEPSVSADAGVIGAAATVFERSLDALLGSG